MALDNILDDVSSSLNSFVDVYQRINEINLQNRITKAAISLQSAGLPTYPMDAQAKAGAYSIGQAQNNGMMMGALLIGAVALFLILKD